MGPSCVFMANKVAFCGEVNSRYSFVRKYSELTRPKQREPSPFVKSKVKSDQSDWPELLADKGKVVVLVGPMTEFLH